MSSELVHGKPRIEIGEPGESLGTAAPSNDLNAGDLDAID